MVVVALCGLLAIGCTSGIEDHPDSAGPSPDESARRPLTVDQYETTIECAGTQGIYPRATGTLTNNADQSTVFEIWVEFYADDELVDASNAFTETLADGETGTWNTITDVREADQCEVACVDRAHPTDPNRRENCQAYADRF